MHLSDDQSEDVRKLFEFLRDGKMSQASIRHIHLKKIHGLSEKEIRKQLTTLGLEAVVLAKIDALKNMEKTEVAAK